MENLKMVKVTVTAYVSEEFLEIETRNAIPTKEELIGVLSKQFPCMECIEVKLEKQ